MWKYIKWFFSGIGLMLCILGIAGIFDHMQIWEKWIELLIGGNNTAINEYMTHDSIKYIFIFAGLFLLLIGSGMSKKIFSFTRIGKKAAIQFKYDEHDKKFYYRNRSDKVHRIYIKNMTDRTIENTTVAITEMKPPHPVFTKKFPVLKSFDFSPGEEPVDVIRLLYKNKRQMYEFMEFEPTMQSYFSVNDKGHEITITVSGENIDPISKKYKFGVKRKVTTSDDFWFKSVN